jgi:hypothetical protein
VALRSATTVRAATPATKRRGTRTASQHSNATKKVATRAYK